MGERNYCYECTTMGGDNRSVWNNGIRIHPNHVETVISNYMKKLKMVISRTTSIIKEIIKYEYKIILL